MPRIIRRYVQRNPIDSQRLQIRMQILQELRGSRANAAVPAAAAGGGVAVVAHDEVTGEPIYFGMHGLTPHGDFRHS